MVCKRLPARQLLRRTTLISNVPAERGVGDPACGRGGAPAFAVGRDRDGHVNVIGVRFVTPKHPPSDNGWSSLIAPISLRGSRRKTEHPSPNRETSNETS